MEGAAFQGDLSVGVVHEVIDRVIEDSAFQGDVGWWDVCCGGGWGCVCVGWLGLGNETLHGAEELRLG